MSCVIDIKQWQKLDGEVARLYGWLEILVGMYQVLLQSICSCVDRENQKDQYVVLKVNNCDYFDRDSAEHELKISQRLAAANPLHNGFPLVRTIIDSFEMEVSRGIHTILVYEPMRETL